MGSSLLVAAGGRDYGLVDAISRVVSKLNQQKHLRECVVLAAETLIQPVPRDFQHLRE